MTDQIQIKDLHLRTIIGINEEERRDRQDVLINIVLYADTQAAGASDDIADAVNYRTITKRVIKLRVEAVSVRVEKPGALRFTRSVGVEIHRTRPVLSPHRPEPVEGSKGQRAPS
jgi:D-erythro-7,8-dihydroneopterin triphosphate epimerase